MLFRSGKKGRNSSSPSTSSFTKPKKQFGTGSRLNDSSPKHPTVPKTARLLDGLTPWEMEVVKASQASRINAIANEEAVTEAVDVLEKSTTTCSNVLITEDELNAPAKASNNTTKAVLYGASSIESDQAKVIKGVLPEPKYTNPNPSVEHSKSEIPED